MVGDDSLGTWWAKGYILCKKEGLCLWFCKVYDDAKMYGRWDHLIYESTIIDTEKEEIIGNWVSKRFNKNENNNLWKGSWKITKFDQNIQI
jgi:hypothetical protein